jgi:hypothetical protein
MHDHESHFIFCSAREVFYLNPGGFIMIYGFWFQISIYSTPLKLRKSSIVFLVGDSHLPRGFETHHQSNRVSPHFSVVSFSLNFGYVAGAGFEILE